MSKDLKNFFEMSFCGNMMNREVSKTNSLICFCSINCWQPWQGQILFVFGCHSLLSTNLILATFDCKSFGNIKKQTPVTLELFLQFVTLLQHFMSYVLAKLLRTNNVSIMIQLKKREYPCPQLCLSLSYPCSNSVRYD